MLTTVSLNLECKLSDGELATIGKQISEMALEIEEIENEKKRIAGLRAEILELSHTLNQGIELRPVECTVLLDTPTVGMKRTVRKDTREIVSEEPMTDEEMQEELFLETGISNKGDKQEAFILPFNATEREKRGENGPVGAKESVDAE